MGRVCNAFVNVLNAYECVEIIAYQTTFLGSIQIVMLYSIFRIRINSIRKVVTLYVSTIWNHHSEIYGHPLT